MTSTTPFDPAPATTLATTRTTTTTTPATTSPVPSPAPADEATVRVPLLRRAAVVLAAVPACGLPLVWGIAAAVELATGVQADHRFHQVTGQGLLLSAVWLGGLLPLVAAGLRGRRPSTAAGLHALAFACATLLVAALSPGDGIAAVAGITTVGAALLWAALPLRPRLRGAFSGGLDVLLAPLALLTAALVTPFALSEIDLQSAHLDEHAELAHYVDMAWVTLALVALAVAAALAPAARRLSVWASAGLVVTGAARYAFTDEVTWSALAVALGGAGLAVAAVRASSSRTAV